MARVSDEGNQLVIKYNIGGAEYEIVIKAADAVSGKIRNDMEGFPDNGVTKYFDDLLATPKSRIGIVDALVFKNFKQNDGPSGQPGHLSFYWDTGEIASIGYFENGRLNDPAPGVDARQAFGSGLVDPDDKVPRSKLTRSESWKNGELQSDMSLPKRLLSSFLLATLRRDLKPRKTEFTLRPSTGEQMSHLPHQPRWWQRNTKGPSR
jgi:hypothetical protein